jgi:hypothetical protein
MPPLCFVYLECPPSGEPYNKSLSFKKFSVGSMGQVKLKLDTPTKVFHKSLFLHNQI